MSNETALTANAEPHLITMLLQTASATLNYGMQRAQVRDPATFAAAQRHLQAGARLQLLFEFHERGGDVRGVVLGPKGETLLQAFRLDAEMIPTN